MESFTLETIFWSSNMVFSSVFTEDETEEMEIQWEALSANPNVKSARIVRTTIETIREK